MTPDQQIKSLAELDGFSEIIKIGGRLCGKTKELPDIVRTMLGDPSFVVLPDYLGSYDAIVPLIQKQNYAVRSEIFNSFDTDKGWTSQAVDMLLATPAQLCEALLRATGRWTE